ncbi:MAG TPA: acetyl-CoA carboxylase biotin carboxyl carrier protein subunit [Dehalococcoidia bacterium]
MAHEVATARPKKGRGGRQDVDDDHFVDGAWTLHSPITGSVVEVRVSAGDAVEAGAILMVVEAMKMQNELRSRVAGSVSTINVEKGQRVETGAALLRVIAPP